MADPQVPVFPSGLWKKGVRNATVNRLTNKSVDPHQTTDLFIYPLLTPTPRNQNRERAVALRLPELKVT